ncbi:unnamed protein product, partial [Polarella glacialis]
TPRASESPVADGGALPRRRPEAAWQSWSSPQAEGSAGSSGERGNPHLEGPQGAWAQNLPVVRRSNGCPPSSEAMGEADPSRGSRSDNILCAVLALIK